MVERKEGGREGGRDRETGRQGDRETERRDTETETETETERGGGRQAGRHSGRQEGRQDGRHREDQPGQARREPGQARGGAPQVLLLVIDEIFSEAPGGGGGGGGVGEGGGGEGGGGGGGGGGVGYERAVEVMGAVLLPKARLALRRRFDQSARWPVRLTSSLTGSLDWIFTISWPFNCTSSFD